MSSPPSRPGRIHSCNYCRRGFLNLQALGGHQNAHRKERSLKSHNLRRDCQCRRHQQMRAMRRRRRMKHQQQRNYYNSTMHMGAPPALGIPAYPPQPALVLYLAPTPTPATAASATTASTSDTTTTTVSADHYCPANLDLTLRL